MPQNSSISVDRPVPERVVVVELEVRGSRRASACSESAASARSPRAWAPRGSRPRPCSPPRLDPYTRSAAAGGWAAGAVPARRPASRSIRRASATTNSVARVSASGSTRSGVSSWVWYQGARLPSSSVVRRVIARRRRTRAGRASSRRGWRIGRAPPLAASAAASASQSSISCGSMGEADHGALADLVGDLAVGDRVDVDEERCVSRSNSLRWARTKARHALAEGLLGAGEDDPDVEVRGRVGRRAPRRRRGPRRLPRRCRRRRGRSPRGRCRSAGRRRRSGRSWGSPGGR